MIGAGVDYYPEHWDKSEWEKDADLMKQTGVKIVRMAEFAWCRLEPHEGEYYFEWLDEAVRIFSEHGIKIILCTPTNCPPLWVYEKYPETIQVGRDGKRIALGIRGHRCYSSEKYRELCGKIITKLIMRYGSNPDVTAWQIDNELDAVSCCCGECTERFRRFLNDKYGTLENINRAYGNVVWSGEYTSWEQIIPPLGSYNIGWYNPALVLDWKRFCQLNLNDFSNYQIKLIRKLAPHAKITTNTWLCADSPDYYAMFEGMDFVSFDNYPTVTIPQEHENIYSHAFHLDLMRGFKPNKSFCIMEQLGGTTGCWMPMQPALQPGMLSGYAMQAIAHGADMVLFFRWRSARKGAEMFWHGILDHSGEPNRRLAELKRFCEDLDKIAEPLDGTLPRNDIAILYSADSFSALDIQAQSEGFHYFNQLKSFHDAALRLGVGCDIIDERCEYSPYKLLIVPTLFITDTDTCRRLRDFANRGGTVVFTDRCGVKGMNNECKAVPLPCEFADMTGCTVSEYDPIGWGRVKLIYGNKEYFATTWCDILSLQAASRIAEYGDRFYAGSTAAAVNSFGDGTVYYIGFCGERDFYYDFLKDVFARLNIPYDTDIPTGVEITYRESDKAKIKFIFNNTDKPVTVKAAGIDCTLSPFEMKTEIFVN